MKDACVPDLGPPWALFTSQGRPVSVMPAGRPGDVFSVEGWTMADALDLVNTANEMHYRAEINRARRSRD